MQLSTRTIGDALSEDAIDMFASERENHLCLGSGGFDHDDLGRDVV
ncbi:MAG TPA: hypothetical protein VM899_03935 [Rubellimicrobium sp.]|jgi:hypothetical protein|nr:hypothetical protein [Rubellimicrobium sp.]